jgi:hypothetical protein
VRSAVTMAIYVLKELRRALKNKHAQQVNLIISPPVIDEILKHKEDLRAIEHKFRTKVNLVSNTACHIEEIKIE